MSHVNPSAQATVSIVPGSNMAEVAGNEQKDGSGGESSNPAAAGIGAGPSSSSATPTVLPLHDLSRHTIGSVLISRSDWTKDMPRTIAEKLFRLSPPDVIAILVVHSDVDGRTLPTFLRELSVSALKKLCTLIGVPVPPKGSADVSSTCVSSIIHMVDDHTAKYPDLVNKDERFPTGSVHLASSSDDEDDVWPAQRSKEKLSSPAASPHRRSSSRARSPKSPPAAARLGKPVSSSSSSSLKVQLPAGTDPSLLALLGGLPSKPNASSSSSSGHLKEKKSSIRRVQLDTKSTKSKRDKKGKKHSRHRSSDDDSDSDGAPSTSSISFTTPICQVGRAASAGPAWCGG